MKIYAWLAAVAVILLPAAAQAKWLRAESAHFVVYSDGGETSLRDYALRLEDLDYGMRVLTGVDPKAPPPLRKLPVYMVRGDAQLKQVWPTADRNIGGFYIVNDRDIFDVSIKKDASAGLLAVDDGTDLVMYHEYAHHFMNQYFPGEYPVWLSEGYAEYFGASAVTTDKIRVGLPPGRQIDPQGEWMPLSTVLTKTVFEVPVDKREDYYIAAWALTHYFLNGPGGGAALGAYLKNVAAGDDSLTAMQKATGSDVATLQKKMIAYIGGQLRYKIVDRPIHAAAEVSVTTLPPSADDLLLERQQLAMFLPADTRKAAVAEIRLDAAKYPNDRFAQLTLARAEIEEGDRLAGERVLAPFLTARPDDAEVNELMGMSQVRALEDGGAAMPAAARRSAVDQAQAYLAVAIRGDPIDYQAMIDYARVSSMLPGYPDETDVLLLIQARKVAPQAPDLTLQTAVALMNSGYFEEAAVMLRSLTADPHDDSLAPLARRLIARAQKKERPTADDFKP